MSAYLLSKHVFLCLKSDQVVILDVKRDRYYALDATRAQPLQALVLGWPAPKTVAPGLSEPTTDGAAAIAQVMVERGLLTTNHALGKVAAPLIMDMPSETLLEEQIQSRPVFRAKHVASFVTASLAAACTLRWHSLERVVLDVMGLRPGGTSSFSTYDFEATRRLVMVFDHLRPFAFSARNACLFDSLALLRFLAHYRTFPRWIFGVHTAPFAAHCWLQQGNTVLNDTADHVRTYTPIMAV